MKQSFTSPLPFDLTTKRVGIWGYGVMGKAAYAYLKNKVAHLAIMDRRLPTPQEQELLGTATWYTQENKDNFFAACDYILPSPGIDVRPYPQLKEKFISELDLFAQAITIPIIAVTGTVGKTTVTRLVAELLKATGKRVIMGGNIGTAVFDLIEPCQQADSALLETSSFQLELSNFFAPHLLIITNIYPNHLDRHGTMDEYRRAKTTVLTRQSTNDIALLPLSLQADIDTNKIPTSAHVAFFSSTYPTDGYHRDRTLYTLKKNMVVRLQRGEERVCADLTPWMQVTYPENLLIAVASLDLLGVDIPTALAVLQNFERSEHRLEMVATIDGVTYYNDSKSTVPEATIAAVKAVSGKPIILLVGGISKGVDRAPLFDAIKYDVRHVICFGKEASILAAGSKKAGISTHDVPTLQEALTLAKTITRPGDQVLFSPSGASFDLFENYEHRGRTFKECVLQTK